MNGILAFDGFMNYWFVYDNIESSW